MNFDNFKRIKGTGEALSAFRELASGKVGWFMLLCCGTAGCGKTHLCEALVNELVKRGMFCRVIEWPTIIRNLKSAIHSAYKGLYDEIFMNLRNAERLIIDDVGMGGTGSNWEWGEFEEIICYRYKNDLFTVVTTNLDLKQLPDRVISRFRDKIKGRIVINEAEDYRPLRVSA